MHIVTRVVLQPRSAGEVLATFDSPEGDVDPYTVLDRYTVRFGDPHDVAVTELPGLPEPVAIGWAFAVPSDMKLPGPPEDFEMLLIPMVPDPVSGGGATGRLQSMFVLQAQERAAFEEAAVPVRHFTAELRDGEMHVRETSSDDRR